MHLHPSAFPAGAEAIRAPLPSHPAPGSVSCIYSLSGPLDQFRSSPTSQKAGNTLPLSPWISLSLLSWGPSPAELSWSGNQVSTSAADTASHLQLPSATVHLLFFPACLKEEGNHLFSPMEDAKHLSGSLYATQKSLLVLFIKPLKMLKHAKSIKNLFLNSKYTPWLLGSVQTDIYGTIYGCCSAYSFSQCMKLHRSDHPSE